MKKKIRKILAAVLTCAMAISAVPVSAQPLETIAAESNSFTPPYGDETVLDGGDTNFHPGISSYFGSWWRFTDTETGGRLIKCYTEYDPQPVTLTLYTYTESEGYRIICRQTTDAPEFYLSYYNRPDAVFYLHLEGNGDCLYFMDRNAQDSIALNATEPFGKDTGVNPLTFQQPEAFTFTNTDDIKWFQLNIPSDIAADSRLKLSFPASAGHPRIDIYTQNDQGKLEHFTSSDNLTYPDRIYCEVTPGAVIYVCMRPWEISADESSVQAELTAKMTGRRYHESGEENVAAPQKIPLSDLVGSLTKNTIQYLNALYLPEDSELGLRILHVDDTDYKVLKTLADKITGGLSSDMEKATAIATWVSRNITYKSVFTDEISVYSADTFYNRFGNCYSYANLIQDLMRLCGIRAAAGIGWRCNPKLFTWESIHAQDITGHAWVYAWLDGDWYLFDPLFDSDRDEAGYQAHAYKDPAYMAQHYYTTYIEGIHMAPDLPSPAILEQGVYYLNGTFAYYQNGVHIADYRHEYLDDDGEQMEFQELSYNNFVLFSSGMTYRYNFTDTFGQTGFRYLDPERELPKRGEVFTNGYFSYGPSRMLAYENSMQANRSILKLDGATYYVDDGGDFCPIFADPSEYSLRSGIITVKTGYSGHLTEPEAVLANKDQILEYTSDNPEIASVDARGNVTAKKPGVTTITCRVWPRDPETGERDPYRGYMGDFAYYLQVDDSERIPDYEDTPQEPGKTLYAPQKVKASNTSAGCKISWSKAAGAKKYRIYRNGTSVGETTSTAWTDTKAKNGKTYTYTVKAVAGKKTSAASAKAVICRLSAVKIKSAKKAASSKAKVTWSKNAAASGYQIKYISGGKTKQLKIRGAKKLTATLKKLTRKKPCKIYVRVYKKVKKATYYSVWSKAKKVKL